ncbi:acyl-CoA thioesterase [Miniimonas arenae]|uniref:acyl-CoA thioesterase n=1 Tax=Miniimonas arenae TaxID=676201 RepID=UPI0028A9FEC6|nr:thioesterase family protein [Miniimonas arenae]
MTSRARVVLPVRWSDIDLFGHVNNAAFLRFLDDARFAAFPLMGVDGSGTVTDAVLVVVKNEIDYLAPVPFTPDPLAVEVWVSRVGSSSVDFGYEVTGGASDRGTPVGAGSDDATPDAAAPDGAAPDGATRAREPRTYLLARSRMVQVDRASGRPQPFTEDERAVLAAHTDAEPVLRGW